MFTLFATCATWAAGSALVLVGLPIVTVAVFCSGRLRRLVGLE